ncbi:hypothetical protein [Rufibacter immobilis]|uniref:hypothetical protein n=1 Tax=Rufibacter immobilis TaxID=1348778 RepID=UPI0011CE0BCC|nr:hypothetical protein [Rufibacter immobilis]
MKDDVDAVEKSIIQVESIFKKLDDSVNLMFVENDNLYINQTDYGNFDSITKEHIQELKQLDTSDWKLLKNNLKLLQRNNINGFSRTRHGFIRFIYKKESDEAYMQRYIALDSGNLKLEHTGYKFLDRKSNLVLLSGR